MHSQDALRNVYNEAIGIAPPVHAVGRLTAEAMTKEFESAGKAIEALGVELLGIKARLDREQQAILEAIDQVNALAKEWFEEGKRMAATVEDCAKQTQRVRDICKELALKSE